MKRFNAKLRAQPAAVVDLEASLLPRNTGIPRMPGPEIHTFGLNRSTI
ncbi:MAG: hypothetical protein QUT30_11325 [Acidobacteriota bacterium]|nr:hypothetical protein [Acidobacteriota bacterium]